MSLAPAPSAAVWLCARCGDKPFTGGPGGIAAHLINEHGVRAMDALREARGPAEAPLPPAPADVAPAPPPPKEAAMPTGVYPRTSDPAKLCGRCKRPKDDHTATCPRRTSATGGGARTKPPKPATARKPGRPKKAARPAAAPTNGADPIATTHTDALFRAASEVIQVLAPLEQDQRGRVLKAVEMLLPLA